ncbi:MAG: hypothetical protein ACM4AI_01310 [Acidobacteriota bacterium]
MHRSGTSALSGVLQRLGLPVPRTPLPADEGNPAGYAESAALAAFHDRLLQAVGSRWDAWVRLGPEWVDSPDAVRFVDECRSLITQEFGDAPLFVVKDPRLCRLVPFWMRVLKAASITPAAIIPIRSPFEVARSLEIRNRLSREQSLLMWLRHVLDAEVETRNTVRTFVAYGNLLSDWKAVIARMSAELEVTWPSQSATAETEVADFLKPDLRHHRVEIESDGLASPLSEWLTRTYDAFGVLLRSENGAAGAYETLDAVKHEFDRAASLFGPMIEAGRSHAADLEEQHTALRQHVSTIETAHENLSERVSHLESERDTLARHAADLEERGALLEQQTSALTQQVSHLTREASNLGQNVTTLSDQVSNLEQRNAQTTHELASAKHHVEALLQSASWRITGPLRAAARVFMGRPKGR